MIERVRGSVRLALVLCVSGCGSQGAQGDAADAGPSKQAFEQAAAALKEPIALIAQHRPFIVPVRAADKYAPKQDPVFDRAAAAASNEIRHAANAGRTKVPSGPGAAGDDLTKALNGVSAACADAADGSAFAKCDAAVQALDGALEKAASATGVAFPRLTPAALTDASKKAVAPLERLRGPSPAEKAYVEKRADASASASDVLAACQAAASEVGAIAAEYERAEEPLRVVGAVHKMNVEAQCRRLEKVDEMQKAVQGCKKTPKKPECVDACGKAKAQLEDGLPAAAFVSLEKDVAAACK